MAAVEDLRAGKTPVYNEALVAAFGRVLSDAEQDPAFAGKLRKQKLSNCGVAQLDLDFGQSDDKPIVGVRLLAGTSLVP